MLLLFLSSLPQQGRLAGGFGCLGGKTNTLPQMGSSHSRELVLAQTPLSGDPTKVQAFAKTGPQRCGVDGAAGSGREPRRAVSVAKWKC